MVKDNQEELRLQIENLFSREKATNTDNQVDHGHGRGETRTCNVIDDLRFLDEKEKWIGLNSIVQVKSERFDKQKQNESSEVRYYISSLDSSAKEINKAIRNHWSVENNLHWTLDAVFKEDSSLKKKGSSAANYNIILKTALAFLEKEKTKRISKPMKRLNAALDNKYRDKTLNF